MPFNRLSFFVLISLPLSVLTACPNSVKRTSRPDICSKLGSYISGSATSADRCFSIVAENDCIPGITEWENAATPYGQNHGLYINAYDAYNMNGDFPRFALNITISKDLHTPLWFMYTDFIKPQDVKCFTLIKNYNESQCVDVLPNYDCLVRDSASSLMTSDSYTTIRFLTNGEKVQYKFRNLYGRDVGDGVIFFYSQTSRMNHLVITFQALAGVYIYKVTLCHKRQTSCPQNFKVDLSDNSTYSERYADLVTLQISQAALQKGHYDLIIQCESLSSNAGSSICCNQSRIFEIYIDHQFSTGDIAVMVALVLFVAFCIANIIVLYLRRKILEPIPSKFRILLIFDAVSIQHTHYVKATRIFLRQLLGVEVLLDVTDMEIKEEASPYQWYITAIERADCIAVVIPPKPEHSQCRGSPYHKTYQLCLNMLASHLENVLMDSKARVSNRYLTLILPNSDLEQIPPFAKFVARFQIPCDYFFLRQHIQSIRSQCCVHLPRWPFFKNMFLCSFLFDQSTTNKLFSTIADRLGVSEEQVPLIPSVQGSDSIQTNHGCQSILLPEELLAIQYRTEELDAIYGKHIQSVRNLADVTDPTRLYVT